MHRHVAKTQTIISDVQRDVVGIHEILKNRKGNNGPPRAVSVIRVFWHHRINNGHRLDSEQVGGPQFFLP